MNCLETHFISEKIIDAVFKKTNLSSRTKLNSLVERGNREQGTEKSIV
jgi:hypothetical protein